MKLNMTCKRTLLAGMTAIVLLTFAVVARFSAAFAADNEKSMSKTEKAEAEKFQFVAYDSFDGKLSLRWQTIRPDPSRSSLTKNTGALTITAQMGTIFAKEKKSPALQAKNIFVIDNPLAEDVDFVVTTCVSGFTPTERYQQAGLILYDDDDNYLKWGYEHDMTKEPGNEQVFILIRETNATPEGDRAEGSESGLKRYWVRLIKRSKNYEYAMSKDGKTFKSYGEKPWNGVPKKIGLLAKKGGVEAKELDAVFEYFELRSPAPTK